MNTFTKYHLNPEEQMLIILLSLCPSLMRLIMAKTKASLSVPTQMKNRYTEITALTDDYCFKKLSEEYAQLSRL